MLLPRVEEPPLSGTRLMLGAGVAWGIYSICSRGVGHPTKETSGNFLRSVPLALVVSAVMFTHSRMDYTGTACAGASGALASGLGYSEKKAQSDH